MEGVFLFFSRGDALTADTAVEGHSSHFRRHACDTAVEGRSSHSAIAHRSPRHDWQALLVVDSARPNGRGGGDANAGRAPRPLNRLAGRAGRARGALTGTCQSGTQVRLLCRLRANHS